MYLFFLVKIHNKRNCFLFFEFFFSFLSFFIFVATALSGCGNGHTQHILLQVALTPGTQTHGKQICSALGA